MTCASGLCGTPGVTCSSGTCGAASLDGAVDVSVSGGATCATGASAAGNVVASNAQFSRAQAAGFVASSPGNVVASNAQFSRAEAAVVVASSPGEWAQLPPVDTAWAQPTDAQLSASVEWAQPTFGAQLETVAVTTERQVSVRQVPLQPVPQAPVCDAACEAQAGFSIALPALFQVMLNVGAPRQGEHRAVPAR